MIKVQNDPDKVHKEISIAPFNYVAKRENVQNVEVFADGMHEFEKLMVK